MSMFHTGLSGLNVARAALMTTAHNTANVYTAGYSRQNAVIVTNVGTASGVRIHRRRRPRRDRGPQLRPLSDRTAQRGQSPGAALAAYGSQINRIDTLLSDKNAGLTPLMQSFFAGVQGVASTPATRPRASS